MPPRSEDTYRSVKKSARKMASEERLERLLSSFASRNKPVLVVRKRDFVLQRLADVGLRIVTLNGQKTYLTNYVTTLGHTIYVPDDFNEWPASHRYKILRHELIHVLQFERYGWVLMTLIYGLFPLPMGLAYGRARLEWEAYAETLRATAEVSGFREASSEALTQMIVDRFTGPDYGWMWPFPNAVRKWIREELSRIQTDLESLHEDGADHS